MSGDCGSVSGVLICWSLDMGSTPDRSLSFSFPLDRLMLTSTIIELCCVALSFCCVVLPCLAFLSISWMTIVMYNRIVTIYEILSHLECSPNNMCILTISSSWV